MNRCLFSALLLVSAVSLVGPAGCSPGGFIALEAGTALGINPAAMDKSISPGSDFYGYANGNWMKANEIPADRSNIGGFYIADRETEERIAATGRCHRQVRPGQRAAMRRGSRPITPPIWTGAGIDAAGLAPIKPDLDRIAAIADVNGLSRVLGEQLRADVDPLNATDFATENLFGVFVTQALAGGEVMPYLLQGGLGMPEREYYLSADAKMAGLRGKYRGYIAQVLTAAGIADPAAMAERIFALESKIAAAHATRAESEDFAKSADEWARNEFATTRPGDRLGSLLRRCAAGKTAEIRRLSCQSDFPAVGAGRFRTAAKLEGLADLPSAQYECRCPAG